MSQIPNRETLLQMAWGCMEAAADPNVTCRMADFYHARARNLMLMATQFLAPEQVREQAEIHAEVSTKAALRAAASSQEQVATLLEILVEFMKAAEETTMRDFDAVYERAVKFVTPLLGG